MIEIIKNNKKILTFIILILISMTTIVFANSPVIIDQNSLGFDNNENYESLNDQGDTNTNTNTNTNNNTNTNTNTNRNTSNNANTNSSKLPQTGIEDYSIGIMIIICIASAIYAYKKVRDYNNI